MPSDEPFVPPRKKVKIFWWLGGIFVFLILFFVLQLFGPNPRIVVSPQTTRITNPLGADGLPDYEQYVRELARAGVTPENNAAVLLWQALFPAEVKPQDVAAMTIELGLEQIPSADEALKAAHGDENRSRIVTWMKTQQPEVPSDPNSEFGNFVSQAVDDMLAEAQKRPWTSEQFPPLAEWVQNNKKPMDLMVEASQRPRYYAPSPSLIDNKSELLISMLLPLAQASRESGRALSTRAMWHLGEGRVDDAWRDLSAVHRLAHLFTQSTTLVEQLIAIAMNDMACEATFVLLHDGKLSAEQARRIQRDLAALPSFANVTRSLDESERSAALDAFMRVGTSGGGELFGAISGGGANDFGTNAFNIFSVDWNLVLRDTNRWYDRLVAAAKLPDFEARATALQQIEADMQQLVVDVRTPTTWLAGVVSRQQRSKLVSSIMLGLFLPAVNAAMEAEDRANGKLELVQLAAALAVYRAEHGTYPEKLDDLLPGVLDSLPVDFYSAKPFVYERDGEGYLLYSMGGNGSDDGGSNEILRTWKGQPLKELTVADEQSPEANVPDGADDVSVRVPRPAFKLPDLTRPPGEL